MRYWWSSILSSWRLSQSPQRERFLKIFLASMYSIRSLRSLMFWLIYLSFINPVWSEWSSLGRNDSILLAIVYARILWSTFKNVMGQQLVSSGKSLSSLGIRDIIPLLWEIDNLPFWKASLYELSKSFCNMSKRFHKLYSKAIFTWRFIFLKRN